MNFTREPIIETVITPREGCKLVIRSSKGHGQEDYFVDAIEVVSFGHSFFFRSQERPRAFLVPMSDYEVLELKETRMVLKTGTTDRSNIKISGGREAPAPREPEPVPRDEALSESRPAERPFNKREKRRRGRRGRDRHEQQSSRDPSNEASLEPRNEGSLPPEGHLPSDEPSKPFAEPEAKAPSFISKLFPPPPTLIKENLSRYKPMENPSEEDLLEERSSGEEPLYEQSFPNDKELEDENEE